MILDFLLVRADERRLLDVATRIAALRHVEEVHAVYGEWDFLVKAGWDIGLREPPDLVARLRAIPGVRHVESLRGFRAGPPGHGDSVRARTAPEDAPHAPATSGG